jgi:hypothetical protein
MQGLDFWLKLKPRPIIMEGICIIKLSDSDRTNNLRREIQNRLTIET